MTQNTLYIADHTSTHDELFAGCDLNGMDAEASQINFEQIMAEQLTARLNRPVEYAYFTHAQQIQARAYAAQNTVEPSITESELHDLRNEVFNDGNFWEE